MKPNLLQVFVTVLTLVLSHATVAETKTLPADPLDSVMWENLAGRFFPGEVVIDQRVIVTGPKDAEDQLQVPITVDATALDNVEEIVALADLNPYPHILTLHPTRAQAFISFRVKLEQASPIRVGVRTSDGVWHVNGIYVTAAGGGCTAPALAYGNDDWYKTLGQTRALLRRESTHSSRLLVRMRHPMDTGLAPGIPPFFMNTLEVSSPAGEKLATVDLFEPVSENPTVTLKPLVEDDINELLVYARDTEANEFNFTLPVTPTTEN